MNIDNDHAPLTSSCHYDLHPALQDHLLTAHAGLRPSAYRKQVLGTVLSKWPEEISAQVLRTRLYEYKRACRQDLFVQNFCSSCAQQKSQSDLMQVVFPPRGTSVMPAWLGWTSIQWEKYGTQWYDKVSYHLSATTYAITYFGVDARVEQAAQELRDATEVNVASL